MTQMTIQQPADNGIVPVQPNLLSMLQAITERDDAPIEALERMMGLYERQQENQAQEKFGHALAAFQAEMPVIKKDRRADRFSFASFDDIMIQATPVLAKYGLSVSFDSVHSDNDGVLTVICRIRAGGYFEDRTFTIPVPASLKVSEPQKFGAALSYAKRYCLCAALNIVTTDLMDLDQLNGKPTEFIDKSQLKKLRAAMNGEHGRTLEQVLGFTKKDTIEETTVDKYITMMKKMGAKP